MTTPSKPPTQWFTPSGHGTTTNIGNAFFVDNSGNFLVDNSGNFLVTTPLIMVPLPSASWGTGATGIDAVEDEAANDVLDEMGSIIYSEQGSVTPTTQWLPPSHYGTNIDIGAAFFTDNTGNFLVDNTGNFLVTTPFVNEPKPATEWSPTPHA
jgi:hypothetical protein